ncbi:sensor histidine kinase [Desulfobacter sp.]|uniref:sensor histidine kinase n=1 Tax=Desulfobacter sp. TaxID=2294 RepID=UPI003D0A6EC9
MFWKRLSEQRRSLSFQLGLSYSLIFGLICLAGIICLNAMISSHVMRGVDRRLMEQKRALEHYAAFHALPVIQGKFLDEAAARGTSRVFYRLVSPVGVILACSDASAWQCCSLDPNRLVQARAQGLIFTDMEMADGPGKARVLTAVITKDRFLQITVFLAEETAFLAKVRTASAILVLAMGAAGIGAGVVMARKALSGLGAVTRAVHRVADGNFQARVDLQGAGVEMVRLGRSYNRMADRIQTLVREMKEVNDNIAHDLRSPVARIRGMAEMAAGDTAMPPRGVETLGSIVEECDRLIHLINTMLEISEAEAGLKEMDSDRMPASQLISETMNLFTPLAEQRNVSLETGTVADITVSGDRRKIQRILGNIVDNAIKYTPSGGRVLLSVKLADSMAVFKVRDTGMGIPPDELPRIFDRFYRADQSRTLPGNGLGLSLAMAFAKAHNGTIDISSTPGRGTTCTLSLPVPAIKSF